MRKTSCHASPGATGCRSSYDPSCAAWRFAPQDVEGAEIDQPMRVCLRAGAVKPGAMKGSGMIEFPGLTVPDWPVVVTDASVALLAE
jgi:hypothetical protein